MDIDKLIQFIESKKKDLNRSMPTYAWQIHHNGGKEEAYDELLEYLKSIKNV